MNKRLEDAIARLKSQPEERQQEAAEILLDFLEQDSADVYLSPEQIAEIERRLEEDDVATDEEVKAFFERLKA
jgi:guanylate kinase